MLLWELSKASWLLFCCRLFLATPKKETAFHEKKMKSSLLGYINLYQRFLPPKGVYSSALHQLQWGSAELDSGCSIHLSSDRSSLSHSAPLLKGINASQGNSRNKQTISTIKQTMQLKLPENLIIYIGLKGLCTYRGVQDSAQLHVTLHSADCTATVALQQLHCTMH